MDFALLSIAWIILKMKCIEIYADSWKITLPLFKAFYFYWEGNGGHYLLMTLFMSIVYNISHKLFCTRHCYKISGFPYLVWDAHLETCLKIIDPTKNVSFSTIISIHSESFLLKVETAKIRSTILSICICHRFKSLVMAINSILHANQLVEQPILLTGYLQNNWYLKFFSIVWEQWIISPNQTYFPKLVSKGFIFLNYCGWVFFPHLSISFHALVLLLWSWKY